ncbi:transcriptional regulator [Dietzia aurantiaca]|uniref:Transcriptional regulator n=1 Tax=Dietzia aurantiaca TaxID=983873 RepID=A0ABV9PMZ6_9ACTN
MTEPQKTTEAAAAEFSRPGPAAADLLAVATSVPGVHAIEPGLGTALRTIDARVRRSSARTAHFGLHIDTAEGTALVEVCLDRSRPVREAVRDIQLELRRALAAQAGETAAEVTVRVQSLQR